MATTNERKALWFLAVVALSGSGVRLWRSQLSEPTRGESTALAAQIDRVDSVRALRHAPSRPRSTARSATTRVEPAPAPTATDAAALIDLDRATAEEIEQLPGIGPALSKRIVAARDSGGAFGAIEALCEVNGVGRVLVEKLRPLVTFTGARRPLSDACGGASRRPRKSRASRSREPR